MHKPALSPHTVVRPLTPADSRDLADLYARCRDYFIVQDGEPPTFEDAEELFGDVPPEKRPEDQTITGWYGANGLDAVSAVLRDYPEDGIWYIGLMLIAPDLRGNGFGRSMYDRIESAARRSGATHLQLVVLEINSAAERFWYSLGFEEIGRIGPDQFKHRSHRRIEMRRVLERDDVARTR